MGWNTDAETSSDWHSTVRETDQAKRERSQAIRALEQAKRQQLNAELKSARQVTPAAKALIIAGKRRQTWFWHE